MSIYNYRKIYQDHFGQIPIDNLGRSYEIHHIDGNRNNNSIENLKCVSIDEHYKIHYEQGDYAACLLMSERMKILPKQKSLLSKKINEEQLKNGTHPFTTEKYKKEQILNILTKNNIETENFNDIVEYISGIKQKKNVSFSSNVIAVEPKNVLNYNNLKYFK